MKTVLNSIAVLAILLLATSCDEEMEYEAQLVFVNSHSESIDLTLYPKNAYKHSESTYKMSDIGSGSLDCKTELLEQ